MPKLTFEDSLRRVALQALLPGLEMAYQTLGTELHRVRMALGFPEEKPLPPAELPDEEEPAQRRLPAPQGTPRAKGGGKFDQPVLDYMASRGGVMVVSEFNKHYKIDSRSGKSKTVASTLYRLLKDKLIDRTGPGVYRLASQTSAPKQTGITDAQRKKMSRIAKQNWTNLSAAAKKKRRDVLEAGKARARAARVRAAKQEARAPETEETPAA